MLAKRAMARADVVVLVVDATEGAGDREGAIAGEAEEAGCGIVIAVNKWDLMKGRGPDFAKTFDDQLRFQLKFLEYVPIVRLSALTGDRTAKLLEVVDRVAAARLRRVPTAELNRFLEAATSAHRPTSKTRREVRVSVRCADVGRTAVIRAVHERRVGAALLVRAVPRESTARDIWIRGHAHSTDDPKEGEGRDTASQKSEVGSRKSEGKSEVRG